MQKIEIRKVFFEKNPKLARLLPGFLFSWLERVIHQKEINVFLKDHGLKQGLPFLEEVLNFFNVKVEVHGLENIPTDGRYLFVSNHPLGGFDGIILMKTLATQFGNVKVIVNDILMNIPNLQPYFLPINKHGHQNKSSALEIDSAFNSNIPILSFPAGLCSRRIKGQITDLEWKKNFISKSVEFKRDVVPIYFDGRNSSFFYNLSNFRMAVGINANIEMLYLVDELFKHRNGLFKVYFGKPIDFKTFDSTKNYTQWANEIRKLSYILKP